MENSKIDVVSFENTTDIDSYTFSTTAPDLANFLINVNLQKKEPNFPNIVLETVLNYSKPTFSNEKNNDLNFFGISSYDENFSCMMISYEKQGVVILTNSKNGQKISQEIIRSIAKAYNWPLFTPKVTKVEKKEIVKNEK